MTLPAPGSDAVTMRPRRRRVLAAAAGLAFAMKSAPALATPQSMAVAIRGYTGGVAPREGRVQIEIAPLVDNGNTVPVKVGVPGVAPAEVTGIAIFAEGNPLPDVVRFEFGPRAATREVVTRIRLATSQQLVAVARFADGGFWSQSVEVVVVLAACIE